MSFPIYSIINTYISWLCIIEFILYYSVNIDDIKTLLMLMDIKLCSFLILAVPVLS